MIRNISIASKIFKTHRTRTMLSVLGIVIGITSVIAIINAGQGLQEYIKKSIEVFGTDYIEVEVKVPNTKQASMENAIGQAQGITITTLKHKEALKLKNNPNIKDVYSAVLSQEIVTFHDVHEVGYLWGVSSGFFNIDKTEIVAGRGFTQKEEKSLAQVVVLGDKIKRDLFGDQNPIGRKIKIKKRNYKVIGVREKIGFMDIYDDMILMPLSTLQKKIMGIDHVSFIMASMVDTAKADQTVAEITDMMRQMHGITNPNKDDFAVTSAGQVMEMVDNIFNALTILLVAVAAISLIVGGVGIMNIMYVSVLERTYEIGLRKSVGASKSDILQQFLSEAILITTLGGIIGVFFGILLTFLISLIALSQGFKIPFIISLPGIFIAVDRKSVV